MKFTQHIYRDAAIIVLCTFLIYADGFYIKLTAGSPSPVAWPDAWTQATSDGLPTAQFEHTLLITETGVEMLTGKLPSSPQYSWDV